MDWRLVFGLSLFGAAMGVATVYVIPSSTEPLWWLAIFVVCAYLIARLAPGRPFLHGVAVGLLNSVWITAAHLLLFGPYIARHPQEAAMMANMPVPDHPRAMMAMVGPIVGLVSGGMIGVLALAGWWLARRSRSRVGPTPR